VSKEKVKLVVSFEVPPDSLKMGFQEVFSTSA